MVTKKRLTFLGLSFWILTACNLVSLPPAPQPTIPSLPTNRAPLLPPPTIPSATALTQYLENPHMVTSDPFDDPSGWKPTSGISNGQLILVGPGGNNWHGLSNTAIFREGEGVMINFQFTPGEFFEMYFEQGQWTTSLYKRFGVYVNEDHSTVNIFTGRVRRDPVRIAGNLSLTPDTWYSLLMGVGGGGDFFAVIWDPANLNQSLQYREVIENWQGIDWTFRMQVNQGTIVFDDFKTIVFDGIK